MNAKTYTFSDELISDFHKDAHGFRPSQAYWSEWGAMRDGEKQAEWDSLGLAMDARSKQEAEDESYSIKKFEETVAVLMNSGAKSREQAVSWLMDANDVSGDDEFFCYLMGLPYGYFKVKA